MSERIGNAVLPEQLSAAAAAQEYAAFLAKFEAKKTTDDCFTPPEVFAAVHRWAELRAAVEAIEWGLSQREREIIARLNDGSADQFDGAVDVFTLSLFAGPGHV